MSRITCRSLPAIALLSLSVGGFAPRPAAADARPATPQAVTPLPTATPAKNLPAWQEKLAAENAASKSTTGLSNDDKRKLLRAGGMLAGGLAGLGLGLVLQRSRRRR